MRNADKTPAAQDPRPDDDAAAAPTARHAAGPPAGAAVYTAAMSQRSRRRQRLTAVAGLVVLIGGGALIARQLGDDSGTVMNGTIGALAPTAVPTASAGSVPPPGTSVAASPGAPAGVAAGRSPAAITAPATAPATAPRTAASTAVTTAATPLTSTSGTAVAGADGVTVTTYGVTNQDRRTMSVVSARADLTGRRELGWVVDAGIRVGSSRCTQTFRIEPGSAARERPTLLLCWRTSAQRSVYTVAIDLDGRPSKQESVAEIDRVWATLG
jgi:hypothetical protein